MKVAERPGDSNKTMTVHIIPHSHDDVGWVKTVDEYYTGARPGTSHASVALILDEVIEALQENERRKFTYVEMKFFTMWYNDQTDKTRAVVKKLIKDGRLEITQGGWAATDEACPNYEDMILNMQKGNQFLQREFGISTRVGWNVDAFGHSAANAALYHDFGFEALFFSRMDDRLRFQLMEKGEMNFVWEPFSKHFGEEKQILVHASTYDYLYPWGFWHEERATGDDPVIANKELETYNLDRKCKMLVNEVFAQSRYHNAEENVAILWGDDFAFQNAFFNFEQIELLIDGCAKTVGKEYNLEFRCSTPGEYIDALKTEDKSWPVYKADLFPYESIAGGRYHFWSGYYTSRPNWKLKIKQYSDLYHSYAKFLSRNFIAGGNSSLTE